MFCRVHCLLLLLLLQVVRFLHVLLNAFSLSAYPGEIISEKDDFLLLTVALATAGGVDITGTFVTEFVIGVSMVNSQFPPFIRDVEGFFFNYGSEVSSSS